MVVPAVFKIIYLQKALKYKKKTHKQMHTWISENDWDEKLFNIYTLIYYIRDILCILHI